MKILFLILAAIFGYLVAAFNPAIAISKGVYHKDIRDCGSGNPGFTNFKRTFGHKWAWWVLLIDLSKAAVAVILFGYLLSLQGVAFDIGAAWTGIFCMIGHSYPVFYKGKGGKGFLVCLSLIWVVDWRVGLIATLIMVFLLLVTKYMSMAAIMSMVIVPLMMWGFGVQTNAILLVTVCVAFMIFRHAANIKRLFIGCENKFSVFGKN